MFSFDDDDDDDYDNNNNNFMYKISMISHISAPSTNFKCGLGLERGPPSLVRTIG